MSDRLRFVIVEDEGVQLGAIGPFPDPEDARRFGRSNLAGAEGKRWEIAAIVPPEDYQGSPWTALDPSRVEIESMEETCFFVALMHQILPVLNVGSIDDYFSQVLPEDERCAVLLKKPLPFDVLKAFLALTRRSQPAEMVTHHGGMRP